jgi:hypothetical protein
MAKNDLLKEAIADAKTVRNTALANAKAALEEAFTPKLKSMLSAKLTEELEEEVELEENPNTSRNGFYENEDENLEEEMYEAEDKGDEANEEVMDEEISLEEILAELELGEASEETGGEGEEPKPLKNEELDEEIDLTEILNEMEMDEEIDLNELLAELSEDNEVEEGQFMGNKLSHGGPKDGYAQSGEENEWDVNFLKKLKSSLGIVGDIPSKGLAFLKQHFVQEPKYAQSGNKLKNPKYPTFLGFEEGKDSSDEETEKMKEELNEAYKVINFQKGKLNEVNVLNSKLLYVNKLFKAFNLTENQKIKVVDSLDQADNTKEAKIIYNTLNETFNSVKTQLKESIKPRSFASKATGLIKENRTRRTEPVNETVARFKKLANIN